MPTLVVQSRLTYLNHINQVTKFTAVKQSPLGAVFVQRTHTSDSSTPDISSKICQAVKKYRNMAWAVIRWSLNSVIPGLNSDQHMLVRPSPST